MKVEIETQIEVTMTMNLREAKAIRGALYRVTQDEVPGSYVLYHDVNAALLRQEHSE